VSGLVNSVSYTAAGDPIQVLYRGGATDGLNHSSQRDWLDTLTASGAARKVFDIAYQRDGSGAVTGIGGDGGATMVTRDAQGRVLKVSGTGQEDFAYSDHGDLLRDSAVGTFTYLPQHPEWLIRAGPHQYHYDEASRVIERDHRKIIWTADGLPAWVQLRDNRWLRLRFDAAGDLVETETRTALTHGHLRGQRRFYGSGFYATAGKIVDRLDVAGTTAETRAGRTALVHRDAVGSPRLATDLTGRVLARRSYSTYGRVQTTTGMASDDSGFAGSRALPGTDLVLMGQRLYDPDIGRFLSPDTRAPAANRPETFSRYAYAADDPYTYNDPTGQQPCDPTDWETCP
jgi:RHS repeat-associated protein